MQERMAKQLHLDAGVPQGSCGYREIRKFEEYLDVQIHVVSASEFNNKVFFFFSLVKKHCFIYYFFKM